LRSWTAGTLNSKSVVEGITTNGIDVWIVDAKTDKVYRYANGATATSGTLTAAGSFSLNTANTSPKDIVTDGMYLWVVNDSTTDKVFKYNLSGTLQGSWTISGGGGSPTGITLDPANVGNLWIVDSATDRIYQFDNAAGVTSGTLTPSVSFALASGNTNPQGIADPPTLTATAGEILVPAVCDTCRTEFVPSGTLVAEPSAVRAWRRPTVAPPERLFSRGVDEVLAQPVIEFELMRPAEIFARASDGLSLRTAPDADVDLLGADWDATLGLIAGDLLADMR
jgi:hypothetical protein